MKKTIFALLITILLAASSPAPEKFLGDAFEGYGYALTGVSVHDPAEPGLIYSPKEGTKLVAVEIIVSNISGDMLGVNPLNATLVDSEGFTYQTELGGVDEQIPTLDIFAGEKVRGFIAFQVPENATPASIKYSLDFMGNKVLKASLMPPSEGHEPVLETSSDEPAQELPKLGEEVQRFGYTLTATTVEDPATPGILFTPRESYRLVAVEIILGNVDNDEFSVNPLNSYLIDADGFVYAVELGGSNDQIDTTKLGTGEKVKGWVAFNIPEDATPAGIRYQTNYSSDYLYTGLGE